MKKFISAIRINVDTHDDGRDVNMLIDYTIESVDDGDYVIYVGDYKDHQQQEGVQNIPERHKDYINVFDRRLPKIFIRKDKSLKSQNIKTVLTDVRRDKGVLMPIYNFIGSINEALNKVPDIILNNAVKACKKAYDKAMKDEDSGEVKKIHVLIPVWNPESEGFAIRINIIDRIFVILF